jgi:hypothetical protein
MPITRKPIALSSVVGLPANAQGGFAFDRASRRRANRTPAKVKRMVSMSTDRGAHPPWTRPDRPPAARNYKIAGCLTKLLHPAVCRRWHVGAACRQRLKAQQALGLGEPAQQCGSSDACGHLDRRPTPSHRGRKVRSTTGPAVPERVASIEKERSGPPVATNMACANGAGRRVMSDARSWLR